MAALTPLRDLIAPSQRTLFTMIERSSVRGVEDLTRAFRLAGHHDVPALSRMTVSRRFQAIGNKLLTAVSRRHLSDVDAVAIQIDGTDVDGRTVVWALGIAADGTKIPLGIAEADCETQDVVTELLEWLAQRKLRTKGVLWIGDGGKAIRPAIERFAGADAPFQLCTVHKTRNVLAALGLNGRIRVGDRAVREALAGIPEDDLAVLRDARDRAAAATTQAGRDRARHAEKRCLRDIGEGVVRRGLAEAWDEPTYDAARKRLEEAVIWLGEWGNPAAAKTLRDHMDATLTLHRLGIDDPSTRRLLRTTNAIESIHTKVARWVDRVKHWSPSDERMRRRFVAVALASAEPSWKPLAKPEQLHEVSAAIARQEDPESPPPAAPVATPAAGAATPWWGRDGHLGSVVRTPPAVRRRHASTPSRVERRAADTLIEILDPEERLLLTLSSHCSTRGIEELTSALEQSGHSVERIPHSTAGARADRVRKRLLQELKTRSLAQRDIVVVQLDGTEVGGRTVVWALGLDAEGRKVPLGLVEGERERKVVATELVEDLVRRGLRIDDVLWITDGGDALIAAITEVAGADAAIQQCLVHKARNVVGALRVSGAVAIGERCAATGADTVPAADLAVLAEARALERAATSKRARARAARSVRTALRTIGEQEVRRRLWAAWNLPTEAAATAALDEIAAWLHEGGHAAAVASLAHDRARTLTLQRLGVRDRETRRLLRTTNAIESVHRTVSELKGRVSRWTSELTEMRVGYVAAAIAWAEPNWNSKSKRQLTRDELASVRWAVSASRHVEVSPAALADPVAALRLVAGDDRRLQVAVAETALEQFPLLWGEDDAALAAVAGRLGDARKAVGALSHDVRAWWESRWHDAAGQAAREWATHRRHPLAGGRGRLLDAEQADRLLGEVARRMGRSAPVPADQAPLAELQVLVERLEHAATAVAAVHVLHLRRQVERAVPSRAATIAADVHVKRTTPIDQHRHGLGRRRTELLQACSDVIARTLATHDDAVLLELRAALADPWRALDPRTANAIVRIESTHRPAARRERSRALASAAGPNGPAAGEQWRRLRELDQRLDGLRATGGGPDDLLIGQPALALHDAVVGEFMRRGRQRAVELMPRAIDGPGVGR